MTSLVCSCKVLINRLPVAANRCERRTEAPRSDAPKRSDVKCSLALPNMERFFSPVRTCEIWSQPPPVASSCSLFPSCHLSAPSKHTDIFSPASESRWKSDDLAGARWRGRLCLPGCRGGLFVLARGWSCRSHQVKQVARCQVIEAIHTDVRRLLTQCVCVCVWRWEPLTSTIGTEELCELITSNWGTCVCVQGWPDIS